MLVKCMLLVFGKIQIDDDNWSILVMWLVCRFLDTEVNILNPGSISMLCP